MGTVALRLIDAHVTLGSGQHRRKVLAGVDLDVRRGEIVTIVGPSGSGKSTLLSALAGLLPLESGRLDAGSDAHRPAIVFQQPLLLPWATVAQNVALGLRYRRQRAGRHERTARALAVLAQLGIADLADRFPAELSGGQAQRVAIARTMVIEPSVLLLDEPFGALDPRTRRELQDWLLTLRSALGLTVVLVTHDVDEALLLGDRVAVLHGPGQPLHLTDSDVGDRADLLATATRTRLLDRLGLGDRSVPLTAAH